MGSEMCIRDSKCTLHFGKGNPEWGAEPDALYYVLKIEKVEEVRNHVLLG